MLRRGLVALVIGMLVNGSTMADDLRDTDLSSAPRQQPQAVPARVSSPGTTPAQPVPIRRLYAAANAPLMRSAPLRAAQPPAAPAAGQVPGYPQLDAALYPSPVPGIPAQIGGTSISNPAFHPHEMLYAHEYRALYAPFYYEVKGEWVVTPFGVWTQENWKLRGTEVKVKYRNRISPFAMFNPPVR